MHMGLGLGLTRQQGGGAPAFSALKAAMAGGQDATILIIGDSTSNATDEWAYLFTQYLATEYPAQSVNYYLWDQTPGTDYVAPVSVQTGSGAGVLSVYNASMPGARASYFMGAFYANAVEAVNPTAIIWNIGGNHVIGATLPFGQGELLASFNQVRETHPNAGVAATLQNPNRDDDNRAAAVLWWRNIAAVTPDLTLIDAYTPFITAGKPADAYADNVHPSAAGHLLYWEPAVEAVWEAARAGERTPFPPHIATIGPNLLTNGVLASTGTSIPTGWGSAGTITYARDAVVKRAGYTDSLQMSATGAAAARLNQQLTGTAATNLRGQSIVLAVWAYIRAGSDATMGRISLGSNGTGGTTINSRSQTEPRDGWVLYAIGPYTVPTDATNIAVNLFIDTDATPDTEAVNYQSAVLAVGSVPRGSPVT